MKKKTQRAHFKMNTTIKQKQKAFIQSSVVLIVAIGILTYFATNVLNMFAETGRSFDKFNAWFTSRPLEIIFSAPTGLALLVSFLICLIIFFLCVRGYTRITDDITTEGGTAQWGSIDEFNSRFSESDNPKKPDHYRDMILSENIRVSTNIYHHQTALNMVILGATRSGKSRFFVKPNILQMNCNYVVTDPKGELLESVGPVLEAFGYKVRVFDIFDKKKCNTYNPFKYLTSEEEVATLAQQLMDATKLGGEEGGGGGGESPFWDLSTLSLLRACIYLLWKYGKGGDFGQDGKYGDAEVFGPGKSYIPCFASVNLMLNLAMERDGKPGQNATLEGSYLDIIMENVRKSSPNTTPYCCLEWDKIKGNPLNPTAATIISNTQARLTLFTIDRIRDLTSDDNIDLDSFGEQKDAIFLIMNPNDKTFNFLLNMMTSQLFNSIYKRGNKLTGCRYAHLENGEFVRFWRPKDRESSEAFEQRVLQDLDAMYKPTIREHQDKNGKFLYYEILDANGVQISARPTKELKDQFLKDMEHMKVEKMHGTMFPFHNRFIIDEFFNVGKIPNFLHVLSTIAGYNGSCDVILQDINQIKSMYDKDWASVFGNCPINLVLKVADNETAKYVSESLGKATVAHAQEQASETSLKSNPRFQIDVKQRDLMTMDEVKTLNNKQEIIIVSGEFPIVDTKHPYTTHELYKYTSDETHIPFDRNRFHIPKAQIVIEGERPDAGPSVEFLSTERIFHLFRDSSNSFMDYEDYEEYDDDSVFGLL